MLSEPEGRHEVAEAGGFPLRLDLLDMTIERIESFEEGLDLAPVRLDPGGRDAHGLADLLGDLVDAALVDREPVVHATAELVGAGERLCDEVLGPEISHDRRVEQPRPGA